MAQSTDTEVQGMERLIDGLANDSVQTVADLNLLQQTIELRQRAVYALARQIERINFDIATTLAGQTELAERSELTRREIEKLLLLSYQNLDFYSQFGFIFSADNFSQAFRRFLFLSELTAFRSYQMGLLKDYKQKVLHYDTMVFRLRNQQKQLVSLQLDQNDRLAKAIERRNYAQRTIRSNSGQFSEALKSNLSSQTRINKDVEQGITLYKTTLELGAPLVVSKWSEANRSFFALKGKLMRPVDSSLVVSLFGMQKHPFLDNVMVKNDGIEFRTPAGAVVRAVHAGIVARVFHIAGGRYAVLLAHGTYYSLYANLSSVQVSEKGSVKSGEPIGLVAEQGRHGLLGFQLWKDRDKLDPMHWLTPQFTTLNILP